MPAGQMLKHFKITEARNIVNMADASLLTKMRNLAMRKHQTNPKRGTFYKITNLYSSKMARS